MYILIYRNPLENTFKRLDDCKYATYEEAWRMASFLLGGPLRGTTIEVMEY